MKAAEIAWAAGLFEGEGCITIFEQKQNVLPLIRLSVQMTDGDVVRRFGSVVGTGKVHGPTRLSNGRKPIYSWAIGNRADVERILIAFKPWLGERRRAKADQALAEIARLDRVCRSCGQQFRARRLDMLCCSVKCRNRWNYLRNRPEKRPSNVGRPRVL